jgi:predicted metal-dependent hydrolase
VRSPIPIRRPALDLSEAIPRHWLGGNAFASHFFDALSSTFPDGEAFFVRSVQHYRASIDDPELLRAISGFAGQEAQHRQQHDRHLALLVASYPALARRNRIMVRVLHRLNRHLPRNSLVATAGLEHLTAIMARRLLGAGRHWCAEMDPRMARLWQWHAVEEAEHKSVAFEVMRRVAPSHRQRVAVQIIDTFWLALEVLDRTLYMLWKDGLLFRRATWREGWAFLFGRDGFLRGLGADYRRWYARDFHPDEVDDAPLVARWRDELAIYTSVRALPNVAR